MPAQTQTRALPPVTLSGSLVWLALVTLLVAMDTVTSLTLLH